ncbi:hypothetical protein Goari_023209 [Gossypium aridum]|uniref:RNase H type-1 domain-containing protein n=1 Tax=Gossypium aridum TaxID=34290 RepID=A0A7J8X2E8_GOSAI|nr:hypothetical protein [Gossypium aridum]
MKLSSKERRALGGFVRTSADLIQLNQILFVDMTPSFTRLSKFQYMRDRNEEVTGCGGVLRDMKGVARALFSGPIVANDTDSTEVGAVFIVLDLFLSMGWKINSSLTVEIG